MLWNPFMVVLPVQALLRRGWYFPIWVFIFLLNLDIDRVDAVKCVISELKFPWVKIVAFGLNIKYKHIVFPFSNNRLLLAHQHPWLFMLEILILFIITCLRMLGQTHRREGQRWLPAICKHWFCCLEVDGRALVFLDRLVLAPILELRRADGFKLVLLCPNWIRLVDKLLNKVAIMSSEITHWYTYSKWALRPSNFGSYFSIPGNDIPFILNAMFWCNSCVGFHFNFYYYK